MAIPVRERVIQEFKYVAQQLTTAEGFHSNCGANVTRGRMSWEEDDRCMSIFPEVEQSSKNAYTYDSHVMPVKFDVLETYADLIAEFGDEAASVMGERVLADLKEVIRRSRGALTTPGIDGEPALVQSIQYTGGGIQKYPKSSEKTVGITASFDVTYETKSGDPYNQ